MLMRRRRVRRRRALVAGAAVGAGVAHHYAKKREGEDLGYGDESVYDDPPPAPPPPGPTQVGAANEIDELQKLGAMHDSGALTDAEFTAAKAKVLGT
jgi:hypothetical protein